MKNPIFLSLITIFWGINVGYSKAPTLIDSTNKELITYMDSIVHQRMIDFGVQGALVAIIHENQYFYHQGYGMADSESNRKVDKNRTSFRIASITKTFTAIAALQLVEQGKLDLHQAVETYLPDKNFSFQKHHLHPGASLLDYPQNGDQRDS